MKGLLLLPAIAFLLFTLPSTDVDARVYTWVDENGKTHYGDKVPSRYRKDSNRVELRGKVSTYSNERIPRTSYGKVATPRSGKRSAAITEVNSSKGKKAPITRHYVSSRHDTKTRHATKSRHASTNRHYKRTRHDTKSRHAY